MPTDAAKLYQRLPRVRPLGLALIVELIERMRPRRVGLVDVGLLGAAQRDGLRIRTLDGALRDAAEALSLAWMPPTPL